MNNPKDKICLESRPSDEALESWLHEKIGPAYDALKADPSRALSIAEVRAKLRADIASQTGAA